MASWTAIVIALIYFSLQYWTINLADRQSAFSANKARPLLYSLAVAASGGSWLYFGSTGYAALHGFEFIGLYVGILLLFTLGYPLLLKLRQLAQAEGITSISDMIGARYGKSFTVAAAITSITAIGLIPYFALQMTAIHYLFDVFAGLYTPQIESNHDHEGHFEAGLVFLAIVGLFIAFYSGKRRPSTERYNGILYALAFDTIIKYASILLVGIGTIVWFFGSPTEIYDTVTRHQSDIPALQREFSVGNFVSLIIVGISSVFVLPSQFHLIVVQNRTTAELRMSRWFMPTTILIVGLFVFPITVIGSIFLPMDTSVDFYFLALPVVAGQHWLAAIAFAGGLAAATTIMLFPAILLSIMISNDLLLPIVLRRASARPDQSKDFTKTILMLRQTAIVAVFLAAFVYRTFVSVHVDFALLILISAIAMIQLAPAFVGGLLWRKANARGVFLGLFAGILIWLYTMVLPSFLPMDSTLLLAGPWGIRLLRPQALLGLDASNFVNGLFWSLLTNIILFVAGSLSRAATPSERIQASAFIADKVLTENDSEEP